MLSLALLTLGVFLLYKAVVGYKHPGLDPVQKFVWYETVGKLPKEPLSGGQLLRHAFAIALLTAGVTLLARLPRLAIGVRWWFFGALAFVSGAGAYVCGVDGPSRDEIGGIYYKLPEPWRAAGSGLFEARLTDWIGPRLNPPGPTLAVIGLALGVSLFGLYQALRIQRKDLKAARGKPRRKKESAPKPRRQRWLFRGMRPLILAGGAAVILITAQRLNDRGGWTPPGVTLTGEVAKVVAVDPPIWPVVLGGAAFLYLWWLAALIFDLGFVWARNVRSAKAIRRVREWSGIPAPDPRKCRLEDRKETAAMT